MYSYHQLHLNLLKKTGTNSENDNVEGGPVEVDEDADNEEEKSSRNQNSSSSTTTAVTAIQLQRLCVLNPPSSTAAVATNVSVGHRFVGIVWDGQITTLYDLWPILKSNLSPPSPAALSAVSVFQLNKQQACVRQLPCFIDFYMCSIFYRKLVLATIGWDLCAFIPMLHCCFN
jgi:hypothetical protein